MSWEEKADTATKATESASGGTSVPSVRDKLPSDMGGVAKAGRDRLMSEKPSVSTDELQDRLGCSEPAAHGVRFCLGLLGGPDVGDVTDTVAEDGFAAAFKLARARLGGGDA
jgi:hypothetical protein